MSTTDPSQAAPGRPRKKTDPILIGGVCFLAYSMCYFGRNLLGAMMPQMEEQGWLLSPYTGKMISLLLFCYGAGQLINGQLGNRIPAFCMVSSGLALAGTLLCTVPTVSSVAVAYLLWGLCGFAFSMLWGPLTATVGNNTEGRIAKLILTLLQVAALAGSALTYFLAYFVSGGSWQTAFRICGGTLIFSGVFCFSFLLILSRKGIVKPPSRPCKTHSGNAHPGIRFFLCPSFLAAVGVAMLNGVIRNATYAWTPTFLYSCLGIDPATVSLISSILPCINIVGILASLVLAKLFRNREMLGGALLFGISAASFFLMLVSRRISAVLTIALLFLTLMAMVGVCNLIFSIYVLRFANTGKLSGISGLLDFSSYMSASVASSFFADLAAARLWDRVILIWAICCLFGVICSLITATGGRSRQALPAGDGRETTG